MSQERRWTVSEWMTDIPLCIPPTLSVRSAFFKMKIGHFRHLLVVQDGKLVGMVTDRDLRRPDVSDEPDGWMELYNLDDNVHVTDVMTRQIETLSPDDPLSRAVDLFLEHRFGALPVVDARGCLSGILSTHDVMRAAMDLLPR